MNNLDITWKALMWTFYYMTLFVSVYYIIQLDWGTMTAFKVIESCGVIGGLMFLGEFFRKDAQDNKDVKKDE